jgi:hypothetical protein
MAARARTAQTRRWPTRRRVALHCHEHRRLRRLLHCRPGCLALYCHRSDVASELSLVTEQTNRCFRAVHACNVNKLAIV